MANPLISGHVRLRRRRTGGSTGAWRGLQLTLSTNYAFGNPATAIPWDTVVVDTDGIYNGSDGGTIPAGMAGLWRPASQCYVTLSANDPTPGAALLYINGSLEVQSPFSAVGAAWTQAVFVIGPRVFVLAEGDEVRIRAGTSSGGSPEIAALDSSFLLEYLGPVPDEGS